MKRLFAIALLLVSSGLLSRAGAQSADAKTVYDENCKKCHGVIGNPPKTMKEKYPKIASFDLKFLEGRSDDSIKKILVKGKGEDMKSFKGKLTEDEIEAVTKYVRELAGKHKP